MLLAKAWTDEKGLGRECKRPTPAVLPADTPTAQASSVLFLGSLSPKSPSSLSAVLEDSYLFPLVFLPILLEVESLLVVSPTEVPLAGF